jgi:hypothetical protein
MTTPFHGIEVACACGMEWSQPETVLDDGWIADAVSSSCVCAPEERVLRAWAYCGRTEPMTVEQRDWCLQEMSRTDGYSAADHVNDSDAELARTVIESWVSYCRDKGLTR